MFLAELIASSFLDLISKRARPECRCKRVLVEKKKNDLISHKLRLFPEKVHYKLPAVNWMKLHSRKKSEMH